MRIEIKDPTIRNVGQEVMLNVAPKGLWICLDESCDCYGAIYFKPDNHHWIIVQDCEKFHMLQDIPQITDFDSGYGKLKVVKFNGSVTLRND